LYRGSRLLQSPAGAVLGRQRLLVGLPQRLPGQLRRQPPFVQELLQRLGAALLEGTKGPLQGPHRALRAGQIHAEPGLETVEELAPLVPCDARSLLANDVPGLAVESDRLLPMTLIPGHGSQIVEAFGHVERTGGKPLPDVQGTLQVALRPGQLSLVT